jgi:hypothetical protein
MIAPCDASGIQSMPLQGNEMKRWFLLGCAILSGAAAAPGQAADQKYFENAVPADKSAHFSINLFGRILLFEMPAGFIPQPPQQARGQYLMELLPRGESFENWSSLITITAFDGVGSSSTSITDIARQIFANSPCAGTQTYNDGGIATTQDGLQQAVIALSCDDLPAGAYSGAIAGASERAAIYVFRDERSLYTLQYAVRGTRGKQDKAPFDNMKALELLQAKLGDVRLIKRPS